MLNLEFSNSISIRAKTFSKFLSCVRMSALVENSISSLCEFHRNSCLSNPVSTFFVDTAVIDEEIHLKKSDITLNRSKTGTKKLANL